ncbi:hypothetical protein GOB86_03405 [Acetobacter lambici]|uniref:Uncharacterized protein n=1 Tax=Acetobacter lambici TaxID=1332824 RepID=A0ABT1F2I8_9PROT|nr:hypothetical protein [Acetobacter lambici]MCP1243081.1 hypothetical protein [Acetobacter lambici]MCP1259201.1 hypothetical protein [Acetobacter lambici]NHO56128.1 hypothetical protein [Acetobacter lambici]
MVVSAMVLVPPILLGWIAMLMFGMLVQISLPAFLVGEATLFRHAVYELGNQKMFPELLCKQ